MAEIDEDMRLQEMESEVQSNAVVEAISSSQLWLKLKLLKL